MDVEIYAAGPYWDPTPDPTRYETEQDIRIPIKGLSLSRDDKITLIRDTGTTDCTLQRLARQWRFVYVGGEAGDRAFTEFSEATANIRGRAGLTKLTCNREKKCTGETTSISLNESGRYLVCWFGSNKHPDAIGLATYLDVDGKLDAGLAIRSPESLRLGSCASECMGIVSSLLA